MFSDDVVYEEHYCICTLSDGTDKLIVGNQYTYILNYHTKAGYNVIRVIINGRITTFYKDVFSRHFVELDVYRKQQLDKLI